MDPIEEVSHELQPYLRGYRQERGPRQWDPKDRLRFALELVRLETEQDRAFAALHAMRQAGYVGFVPFPKPFVSLESIREGEYWVPRDRNQLNRILEETTGE